MIIINSLFIIASSALLYSSWLAIIANKNYDPWESWPNLIIALLSLIVLGPVCLIFNIIMLISYIKGQL